MAPKSNSHILAFSVVLACFVGISTVHGYHPPHADKECDYKPCQNGGTCVENGINLYSCVCAADENGKAYGGHDCELKLRHEEFQFIPQPSTFEFETSGSCGIYNARLVLYKAPINFGANVNPMTFAGFGKTEHIMQEHTNMSELQKYCKSGGSEGFEEDGFSTLRTCINADRSGICRRLPSDVIAFVGGVFNSYRVEPGYEHECGILVQFYMDPECRYMQEVDTRVWENTKLLVNQTTYDNIESRNLTVLSMYGNNKGVCNVNTEDVGSIGTQFVIDPFSCTDTVDPLGIVHESTYCGTGIIIEIPNCVREDVHDDSHALIWSVFSISLLTTLLSIFSRAKGAQNVKKNSS